MTIQELLGLTAVLVVGLVLGIVLPRLDKLSTIQRERRGYDWSWLIIILIFVAIITLSVLSNKGILNY